MSFTSWPTFHITVSGSVVAAYAAILSTITGAAQLWNYTRDRARIRVSAQNNMTMFGDVLYKANQTLCIVTVANLGRRPVTITTVGGYREIPLHPFFVVECRPNLPHELTEGKHLIAILPSAEMDVSKVLWWSASDGVGNQYYSKGGGWYARRKHWRDVKKHEKKGLVL
jgi:hypothetical protein